jgi:hypothetical protein
LTIPRNPLREGRGEKKMEPKFSIGDIVVSRMMGTTGMVTEIQNRPFENDPEKKPRYFFTVKWFDYHTEVTPNLSDFDLKLAEKEEPVEKSEKVWTRQEIVAMLEQDAAVNRGVVALAKNVDLLPEKTRSYVINWGNWVASGKALSGKHLVNARRTCIFNSKVLTQIANKEV